MSLWAMMAGEREKSRRAAIEAHGGTPDDLPGSARLADCRKLIGELEQRLDDLSRQVEEARRVRSETALGAAEGNGPDRKLLADATKRTLELGLENENLELALAAARERLAGLEAERLAREREEALALCDRRAEACRAVDEALALLWRAWNARTATTDALEGYRDRGQAWLPGDLRTTDDLLFKHAAGAVAYELPSWFGMGHASNSEIRPLADSDHAVLWARKERGEEVDTSMDREPWRRPEAA